MDLWDRMEEHLAANVESILRTVFHLICTGVIDYY